MIDSQVQIHFGDRDAGLRLRHVGARGADHRYELQAVLYLLAAPCTRAGSAGDPEDRRRDLPVPGKPTSVCRCACRRSLRMPSPKPTDEVAYAADPTQADLFDLPIRPNWSIGQPRPPRPLALLDDWCSPGPAAPARCRAGELAGRRVPQAGPELLLAAAPLAQREGRGHTGIERPRLLAQRRPSGCARRRRGLA